VKIGVGTLAGAVSVRSAVPKSVFGESNIRRIRVPMIYDSVVMASIGPLSEASISSGSRPIEVPDFTRGKWETMPPYFGL